jgi:hypothetical protein
MKDTKLTTSLYSQVIGEPPSLPSLPPPPLPPTPLATLDALSLSEYTDARRIVGAMEKKETSSVKTSRLLRASINCVFVNVPPPAVSIILNIGSRTFMSAFRCSTAGVSPAGGGITFAYTDCVVCPPGFPPVGDVRNDPFFIPIRDTVGLRPAAGRGGGPGGVGL